VTCRLQRITAVTPVPPHANRPAPTPDFSVRLSPHSSKIPYNRRNNETTNPKQPLGFCNFTRKEEEEKLKRSYTVQLTGFKFSQE